MQSNKYIKFTAWSLFLQCTALSLIVEPFLSEINIWFAYERLFVMWVVVQLYSVFACQYMRGITEFVHTLPVGLVGFFIVYKFGDEMYCSNIYASAVDSCAGNELLNQQPRYDNAVYVCSAMIVYFLIFCWCVRNRK